VVPGGDVVVPGGRITIGGHLRAGAVVVAGGAVVVAGGAVVVDGGVVCVAGGAVVVDGGLVVVDGGFTVDVVAGGGVAVVGVVSVGGVAAVSPGGVTAGSDGLPPIGSIVTGGAVFTSMTGGSLSVAVARDRTTYTAADAPPMNRRPSRPTPSRMPHGPLRGRGLLYDGAYPIGPATVAGRTPAGMGVPGLGVIAPAAGATG